MEVSTIEAKRLHPRVALSGLCFPGLSAVEAIAEIGAIGVTKTSLTSAKLRESGVEAVLAAGRDRDVEVVTTTALVRFDLSAGADVDEQTRRAREDIDQAAAVGATSVYTLTGPRVYADWTANVESYARLAKDLVDYAAGKNLSIAVEPTNWLYADLTFIHSFRDAVEFSAQAGLRVCLDLFHVWTESDLRQMIGKHVDLISHVQVSDMERGARALPCRAVPGAGDVPIRTVVGWLLDAGYAGVFDLELSGPGIDEAGHRAAAARSASWLHDLMVELGA